MVAITVEQAFQTALTFHQAGQLEAAEAMYRQVVAAQPAKAEAWQQLGLLASGARRHREAVDCFRMMVELRPEQAEGHCNLGSALTELGAWNEAVTSFQRALTLNPQMAEAYSNLGRALTKQGFYDEAIAAIEHSLKLKPGVAATYGNLGHTLYRSGRFDEAVACYREWIARHPQDATAHRSLGHMLLLLGHFAEGWREFEWRQRDPATPWVHRNFAQPQWNGGAMPGETLLLYAEQGFGDAIHFLRYLPLAACRAAAGRVIVESPPKLVRLLRQNCPAEVEVVPNDSTLPPFDRQCGLMSLPFALDEPEPLTMTVPYLHADPKLRQMWRTRLGPAKQLRVGFCWAGSRVHVNDQRRSIIAHDLVPVMLVNPEVTFYSLQTEPDERELRDLRQAGLIDLSRDLTDFADTAALVAELDLVISVDTAVAHLAGALGRPVWTLLPFAPDWRWGPKGEETRWYPTMRLFRQPAQGNWSQPIERAGTELQALVKR